MARESRRFAPSNRRSEEKIRNLGPEKLGLPLPGVALPPQRPVEPLQSEIADDDPLLVRVKQLLQDGYAGVIFSGPPGTSKSWYAGQIAAKLADNDPERVRSIQFHASYQYEDFVEGFVPRKGKRSGFKLQGKHLLEMINAANRANGRLCVLVIDEFSRGDPGRIFGEALTYLEMSKRDKEFLLASGSSVSIPKNLVFLATMNPLDRSVDEVDAAVERRFAKVEMSPDADRLKVILAKNGLDPELTSRIVRFFEAVNARAGSEFARLGQAYFNPVRDEDGLRRLWENQLQFYFSKAYRLDQDGLDDIKKLWKRVFEGRPGGSGSAAGTAPASSSNESGGPGTAVEAGQDRGGS
jgi:5-methylcytosine-specific restriction protein B